MPSNSYKVFLREGQEANRGYALILDMEATDGHVPGHGNINGYEYTFVGESRQATRTVFTGSVMDRLGIE